MGSESSGQGQGDLFATLQSLLSNPAAISMLSSLLAGSGGKGGGQGGGPCPPPPEKDCPKAPPLLPPTPPPKKPPQDSRTCLLQALRPYLSPARCETIDALLRILELMELLKQRRT